MDVIELQATNLIGNLWIYIPVNYWFSASMSLWRA